MDFAFMRFGAKLARQSGLLHIAESIEAHRGNLLRILAYHRIGNPGVNDGLLDPSLISATPDQFEQQMRFLREHYRLLSIRDLLQVIEANESLPPKSVMVTFDDGYHDFLDTAWPILERYEIPTLMFLATGFLSPENQLFWWDRLYQGIYKTKSKRLYLPPDCDFLLLTSKQRWEAFLKLKNRICSMDFQLAMQLLNRIMEEVDVIPKTTGFLLNCSEARALNERGCYLASHTRSHPILSRISIEDARQEFRDSLQDICREIGTVWPVIAYPSGHLRDISDDLLPILAEEGFRFAMTSIPGINVMSRVNLLRLKRIDLSPQLTLPEFRLTLTGIYHFFCSFQNSLSLS